MLVTTVRLEAIRRCLKNHSTTLVWAEITEETENRDRLARAMQAVNDTSKARNRTGRTFGVCN